jgi:hypothetical protein
MQKEQLNMSFILAWLYLLVGIGSSFDVGYLDIRYFLISRDKWYIIDFSINFICAIGLFVTLVISLKKTSEMIKILLYRVFIALGLMGALLLIALRYYFYMAIPNFPPKFIIATLMIDGIIIKMILDKKIKPLFT